MNLYPNRKSNRLEEYDYASNGAYFITICTRDHRHLLSRVDGTEDAANVLLSEWGQVVDAAIREIPTHYENVTVDRYVVMPNHVHLLLRIGETNGRMVSAPTVVGSLKRFVSKSIGAPIWQKGFYDHVIRGEDDYLLTCRYIDENPQKWLLGKDEYA
ncbi:MAG: transposase [Oscillospiraceae bacterium]|nr:transposase [Oscillospiraceae bacterium]